VKFNENNNKLLFAVISLIPGKMIPIVFKSNEKDKEFEDNFLIICKFIILQKFKG
jgi:hypothetical protein